jgi:HD-GYP domain-containing protein (c-di-GMP phosphodiesterase class II)
MEPTPPGNENRTGELLAVLDRVELIVKQLVTAGSQAFLYSGAHPAVREYIERAFGTIGEILARRESFAVSAREGMLVYENIPLYRLSVSARKFVDYLEARKIHGIIIARGLAIEELVGFVEVLVSPSVQVRGRDEFNRELERRGVKAITVMEIKKEEEKGRPARKPQAVYEETVRLMRAFTKAALTGKELDLPGADSLVSEISELAAKDPRAMLDLSAIRDFDEHAFTHAAHVCVLSTSLAALMGVRRARLAAICRAAMLHDIGKLAFPAETLFAPGEPDPATAELLRRHPLEGARALLEGVEARPLAVAVAYEHHMRYDLAGYPARPDGVRPHPVSLLVQIVDAYDNLTARRPGRLPLSRPAALERIAEEAGSTYDPAIAKGFLAMMGCYVPGTIVELDGGEIGVVEEVRGNDPARPVARMLGRGTPGGLRDLGEKDAGGAFRWSIRRPLGAERVPPPEEEES